MFKQKCSIAFKIFEQNSTFTLQMFRLKSCFATKIMTKIFALHPKCLNKVLLHTQNVEQKSCFVPKQFKQQSFCAIQMCKQTSCLMSCFAPQTLKIVLLYTHNWSTKSCFAPKMFEQNLCFTPKGWTKVLHCTQTVWTIVFLCNTNV